MSGRCLQRQLEQLGGLYDNSECDCRQPCDDTNFDVTYSCSKWPAGPMKSQVRLTIGSKNFDIAINTRVFFFL